MNIFSKLVALEQVVHLNLGFVSWEYFAARQKAQYRYNIELHLELQFTLQTSYFMNR
jgi:hypothetical protein